MIPLSGSVEQITSVSSAYGTFFRSGREKAGEGNSYTVDHSAFVYLLDDQGRLMRVLDHDVQAEQISELLHKLL
ncbi:SCO family protein [Oleiphilus sp. HI0117]|uniref:SCO family protein n=1 Tax=Oleiphilus sp. HI0117 TaxID=1822261 RepID=UPI003514A05A